MLADLNTRPRTTYVAAVLNPNRAEEAVEHEATGIGNSGWPAEAVDEAARRTMATSD